MRRAIGIALAMVLLATVAGCRGGGDGRPLQTEAGLPVTAAERAKVIEVLELWNFCLSPAPFDFEDVQIVPTRVAETKNPLDTPDRRPLAVTLKNGFSYVVRLRGTDYPTVSLVSDSAKDGAKQAQSEPGVDCMTP